MSESSSRVLTVDLGERAYSISIAGGLVAQCDLFEPFVKGVQVLIVTNETIAPLYLDSLTATLQENASRVESLILPDGERFKNLETISHIYDQLMQLRFDRGCLLVALGGGVVGDMTGFAAATYQRGVRFVQVPTTLLSQVDSSVGGKTGVNHPSGKNMIGAFHQPDTVIIDIDTLATLPEREYIAGLAEVIKYGLIADKPFLDWLAANMDALHRRDEAALVEAIAKSCECKAKIVAADERESGIRAILNLGHTFGHAFETATDYKFWLHGEAVGYGMLMALDMSRRLGHISADHEVYARDILRSARLPATPPAVKSDLIRRLMGSDKKVQNGQLRLVLLKTLGEAFVTADFDASTLDATLMHFLGE